MPTDAVGIAAEVRAGRLRAVAVAEHALAAIAAGDGTVNSFTAVLADRALADAGRVDADVAAGIDPGPLAGAPFAVKNLFDVAGEVTVAGAKISAEDPPARADAEAVARLGRAGAVLVGMLNMDEYAYGFTTENAHFGACRNPFDPERVAGGSSGGSGAAVAAGFVPLALGSDTNGSVRVPAALCGVFSLKPTHGRISCAGRYPFCDTLDAVGTFARSVRDLAVSFDLLDGGGGAPAALDRPPPVGPEDPDGPDGPGDPGGGLRIALADGYFARGGEPAALAAAADLAAALGVTRRVTLPGAAEARAAAMVITAAEGAQLHLEDLRRRPADFDPMTRDRFLAGALVPARAYVGAQRFRAWFGARMTEVFRTVDVVLAPATPFAAPVVGQREAMVDGETVLTQPYLGVYTQPISFAGLPVVTVPVRTDGGGLPLGVQLIGGHHTEATLLRVAARLERRGLAAVGEVPVPWR
ncbi:MAG TPA: AtzE family amidohydrolase [Solirubrobacteraceae bacterium]|nr:AtzE family amidohydrolase [Solirubrobacteraceae bacterium]